MASRSPWSGTKTNTVTQREDSSAEARRKLEAMFGGTPSTTEVSRSGSASERQVFANPRKSGRTPSKYRLRLERLRIAREDHEIIEAANTFLEHHQIPDDLDVLYKLLRHSSEPVIREAIGQISSLLMQGRVVPTVLLDERLKDVLTRTQEPVTKTYVEGLQSQIAKNKRG
jgi:hypothetical protein